MFWSRGNLEERVAELEIKYDQLATEVARIERDLVRILKMVEELKDETHEAIHRCEG